TPLGLVARESSCRPVPGGGFGVVQLFRASPVAMLFDQVAGLGEFGPVAEEADAVGVDVGEEQRHRAAGPASPGPGTLLPWATPRKVTVLPTSLEVIMPGHDVIDELAEAPASRVRYAVLAAVCVLAVITYLHRAGFQSNSPELLHNLGMDVRDLSHMTVA